MIVTDDRAARFVSERLDFAIAPPFTCMGIERDGHIVAGVIFHCFEGAAIHVTVAGSGWTPGFVRDVGEYVFGQLECCRITVTTGRSDVARIALRMGGKVEGCLRDQFGPGRDATIIGILRGEWKFGKFPLS